MSTPEKKCQTTVMSRVTGFYSHFHAFNPGKQEEFKDRKKFDKSLKATPNAGSRELEYPEAESDGFR